MILKSWRLNSSVSEWWALPQTQLPLRRTGRSHWLPCPTQTKRSHMNGGFVRERSGLLSAQCSRDPSSVVWRPEMERGDADCAVRTTLSHTDGTKVRHCGARKLENHTWWNLSPQRKNEKGVKVSGEGTSFRLDHSDLKLELWLYKKSRAHVWGLTRPLSPARLSCPDKQLIMTLKQNFSVLKGWGTEAVHLCYKF